MLDSTCPGCKGARMVPNRTGALQVCPLCEGSGMWENFVRRAKSYAINATMAASGTARGTLAFDDIDFELLQLMRTATGGTFTSEFQDASGRFWQNLPVNDLNRFGTAERPFPIGLAPVYIDRKSTLNWTVVDTSGNANVAQMVLAGYDLFPRRGYVPQR